MFRSNVLDIIFPNNYISGLALDALRKGYLRFPVRPKMHSFEHMILGFYFGFFLGVIPKISPCESLFGGVPIKIIGWEIYDPEW